MLGWKVELRVRPRVRLILGEAPALVEVTVKAEPGVSGAEVSGVTREAAECAQAIAAAATPMQEQRNGA